MVIKELECSNGTQVKFEESPYYYELTIGRKTWYWRRDTGEFDGTSFKVAED